MFLQGSCILFSQNEVEPIRIVFNQYATKEANDEWSEWKSGQNIFILDYNSNGDLMHFKSGGSKELYIKRTAWVDGKDKNGNDYIIADFILSTGAECRVQVYTKPRVFIKVILGEGDLIIQFDNS